MAFIMQYTLLSGCRLVPHVRKSVYCIGTAKLHATSHHDAEYVRLRRVQHIQRLGVKPSEKWKPIRGRKPLFVPPAKTKFFNVPQITQHPADEAALLRGWAVAYEASLDGLYTLFRYDEETNEARRASSIREDNPLTSADLRDAITEFNRESQRLRIAALPKWLATAKQDAAKKRQQYQDADFRELVRIEKRLQTDLKEADRFIDSTNLHSVDLDALVRDVVDSPPSSYEFAIDERGERLTKQRLSAASVASSKDASSESSNSTSAEPNPGNDEKNNR